MGFRCTAYFARHSWATIAVELGASKDTVSAALGHSHSVTDIYVDYDVRLVDDAQRSVFNAVFGE